MDAWDIVEALIFGSDLAPSQLRRINTIGDDADRLYISLFRAVRSERLGNKAAEDVAAMCPHPPTAKAWLHILRYTNARTRGQYQKIVKTAEDGDRTSATLIRLAPLVLSGPHRHLFAKRIGQVISHDPERGDDVAMVIAELRQRGPTRLYARREKASRRKR